MGAPTKLTASLEDYLEAIFHIIAEKRAARPKDIAMRLKVSNASVTGALRSLAQKGLINYAPYDIITLSREGERIARDVVRRHEVLRDFFIKVLAVERGEADQAACRMEHAIPSSILERFVDFINFVEVCPRAGSKWIAGFSYNCNLGASHEECQQCMSANIEDHRKKMEKGGEREVKRRRLNGLEKGQRAKVVKISLRGEGSGRIAEMGITPGTVIEVEKVAPLGDPMDIKVKGYHLSLRKEEAEAIEVEEL